MKLDQRTTEIRKLIRVPLRAIRFIRKGLFPENATRKLVRTGTISRVDSIRIK